MLYRKLKRTWTHSYMNYIPKFNKVFPELNKIGDEDMVDRFIELGLDFYTEERIQVRPLVRLTLPFAIMLIILMFITLPIRFLIFGTWGYSLSGKNIILNWFKSLHLQ